MSTSYVSLHSIAFVCIQQSFSCQCIQILIQLASFVARLVATIATCVTSIESKLDFVLVDVILFGFICILQ
jgi:hypothetical protein